jgi:hypothetical protein
MSARLSSQQSPIDKQITAVQACSAVPLFLGAA